MNSKSITLIAISIASIAGFSVFLIFQEGEAQVLSYDGPPKALIIDQLYSEFPNDAFHKRATGYLETAGYDVDIVTTEDVTVEYYKNLPSMGYKFVVIRTHGADNVDGNEVVLFTGEKYTDQKYINEQLFGEVKKATPFLEVAYNIESKPESDWTIVNDTYRYMSSSANVSTDAENEFFAISPKMIKSMKGKFSDTIILLGGCNTLSNPSLAEALVDKGASTVFGWNNKIGNLDNDYALLLFLERNLIDGLEYEEVLEKMPSNARLQSMPFKANFKQYTND